MVRSHCRESGRCGIASSGNLSVNLKNLPIVRRLVFAVLFTASLSSARAEVILQYFNTSWRELAEKMPEIAEAGYGALWLPPPTKGSGGLSVGYDLWDPFDIGGQEQRSTIKTRYGTEAELLALIEVAHRFGIRVYFDNIMNHRAFDVPGYNETTPIDIYPGLVPEDFHLRLTEDGFYRKWDNVANWNDAWQVQNRNFSDLIDISQESPNANFGKTEGSTFPKISFVRQKTLPQFYDFHPTLGRVGFYSTNITAALLTNSGSFYSEDVGAYMMRNVRWMMDRTKVDGLRLDAVKHVPSYFFGAQGGGKDTSNAGYTGQAQEQFNITRGFSDANHRDSVFNTEIGRDDAMMFGEHLGSPPGFSEYTSAGMRLVDATLKNKMNDVLGNPSASLAGLDAAGFSGDPAFNQFTGVMFSKSHDDDYVTRPELHHAYYLTRQGLPNIYTDGNYQSETLAQSGGAFPRHANTAFLGQFNDSRIPNLAYVHNHFARGDQNARWSDGDVVAYERIDKRENGGMSDTDGCTLFFVMNDNYSAGQYREIPTSFNAGAKLWQYSTGGGNFYYTVPGDQKIKVITPPGGYFAFSWRTPEESDLWKGAGGNAVQLYQNGRRVDSMTVTRRDGPDGDKAFNPYGLPDPIQTDYSYSMTIPRVTSATNLRFAARVDGSAIDLRFKLDGGIDVNSQMGLGDLGEMAKRDAPPAVTTDTFAGYESAQFVRRQFREKFAAKDTVSNNVIGSAGAETYVATIGSSNVTINTGVPGRDSDANTAQFVFHDPAATITASNQPAILQFDPPPQSAANSNVSVWVQVGYACEVSRAFVYYTTDGATYPEGGGGEGVNTNTKVVEAFFVDHDQANGTKDWWRAVLPAMTNGTVLRYKAGFFKQQGHGCNTNDWTVPFPDSDANIALKKSMMGLWEVTNFNAATIVYKPHNDFGGSVTGLVEGMHVLTARAYLERNNRAALYNSFIQSFYYDAMSPTGRIIYPANNGDDLYQSSYGVVVRTDPTVKTAWFNIADNDPANDDANTGVANGNGTNAAGQTAWATVYEVTPNPAVVSPFSSEWRFTFRNIPSSGSATINVKLAELSSSTNPLLSDAAGHFTTLTRTVDCFAPTELFYFDWPTTDGQTIEAGWLVRVHFSKSLVDPFNDTDMLNRFLITVDDVAQSRTGYMITRDIGGGLGRIEFAIPNLYNGESNALHSIRVTFLDNGDVTHEASRFFKTRAAAQGPYVAIITPPEVDSDGQPYVIILPDVASPTPEQRSFLIKVDTDLSAQNTWIEFANNAGSAGAVTSSEATVAGLVDVTSGSTAAVGKEKQLSGTVTAINSNGALVGSGTLFLTELVEGNLVRIDTNFVTVTQILSATSALISPLYEGTSVTGATYFVQPALDSELQAGSQVRIGTNSLIVASATSPTNITFSTAYPDATAANQTLYRIDGNPSVSGSRKHWSFLWTNMMQGYFTFYAQVDTNGNTGTIEASATRNTRVLFREIVASNTNDFDDDDDGLYDFNEITATNLPTSNAETWNNGQVHIWYAYGKSDALSPDTDGDGLPDGLESGWRGVIDPAQTDTNADTNGDGTKNFTPDLDPPFFNTLDNYGCVPGVNSTTEGGDRARLVRGTMTSPNNPDSDYDGISDGVEDANRNGWTDGDGNRLLPGQSTCARTNWPTGVWNSSWLETSPLLWDSDVDNAGDGQEDADRNGRIAGDSNSNRVREATEEWTESNPLDPDTDNDGLPDGWENTYSFDPLDDGTDSMRTTNTADGLVVNGANGNPDGDTIIVGTNSVPYTNLMEYQNGTNPRLADNGAPPPPGGIVIGPGAALGVVNGVTNYQEFTDWKWDDLIVLDEYEGDGPNNQGGDLYLAYDGWDTSRDIVAFYARDGGDPVGGGDGNFYFRADFHDLQAFAEEANLNIYVVIDSGNPASGEMALPDDVDLMTSNRWEAVVAVYKTDQGRVYVDTDHSNNTTLVGQGGNLVAYGVQVRDQNSANGFKRAYFNSELDACEFSISRQALRDAGWNGLDAADLNYQIFVTKDETCNSCGANSAPGAGDIGGRNDVRDTIYDDDVAEDYWQNQPSIKNVLSHWFSGGNGAGRSKVAVVVHGNHSIQPGSYAQSLVNNGAGAGYYRPLDVHEVFGQPLNLHITPTLASALQWARVDTNVSPTWRDGALFNARLRSLVATNIVSLLGSTFSDHALPYFTKEFNRDNDALAREYLSKIYGASFNSSSVFWPPERVLDGDVYGKILDMGYNVTLCDQDTHLFSWLGRTTSLADGAYQINQINGVKNFVIHNQASTYRFLNADKGLDLSLRGLFLRKARSGSQDQVVVLQSNWEDFGTKASADGYDANVRWIANHPWIKLASLQDIAAGQVDLGGDGTGDMWFVQNRGNAAGTKTSHNWIQHAAEENLDNWYLGGALAEGLQNKIFQIRGGTNVVQAYGMMYTPGIITNAWTQVNAITDTNLAKLARAALHASVFQTAFHNEDNNDLSRYSIGTYIYPDGSYDSLASFAKNAQAQSRVASLYRHVDLWANIAAYQTTTTVAQADVDLDGENEFILSNDRLYGIFERSGGRLVAVFVRDILSGRVFQALGNQSGASGSETEDEGAFSVQTNGTIVAYRTSGLKDWYSAGSVGVGYNNMVYSFAPVANGWQITSSNGAITKTATLAPKGWNFEVNYQCSGVASNASLYVRNGLSPNLGDLLVNGQQYLGNANVAGNVIALANTNYDYTVTASVGFSDAGHNAGYVANATDDNPGAGVNFYTLNMRNQAQTHQVEIVGTNNFSFSLGFHAKASDWDGDGIPNTYEDGYGFLNSTNFGDGSTDFDNDGANNYAEYIAKTQPNNGADFFHLTQQSLTNANGIVIQFPSQTQRDYFIWYANNALINPAWLLTSSNGIPGTGSIIHWTDDGSQTAPAPSLATNRFYKIQVDLPK